MAKVQVLRNDGTVTETDCIGLNHRAGDSRIVELTDEIACLQQLLIGDIIATLVQEGTIDGVQARELRTIFKTL